MAVLAESNVASRIPAQDLSRARSSYAEKLGLEPVEECAPPCREVARPVGRGENRRRMPPLSQLSGDPGHVLVDVVGLRPGEGRDEADSEAHLLRV